MAKKSYSESDIQVLEGLEAIRKRPGMYIGSTDGRGLHHLIWEIVDNAIDEVLAGEANHIKVTIHKGNSVEISDNGRGIPIGIHEKAKIPTPQLVYCKLHAGGKFGGDGAYKVSGGLHGVGSAVVNALSSWVELTIQRDGQVYFQRFENGGAKINKPKVTKATTNVKKTGTTVHFKPDPDIFSTTIFDYKQCCTRFKEAAYLIKGLKIDLVDERNGQSDSFHFDNGIVEYLKEINATKTPATEPIYIEGNNNGIQIEAVLQYSENYYSENIISFVNNIRTKDGGTHETGFKSGLTKAVNEYARMKGLLKEKDPNLEGIDIREGLTAILSIRIPEDLLQFEGQTKNKLGTADAKPAVDAIVSEKVGFYLAEKGEIANNLINKTIKAAKVRETARLAKENARMQKKKTTKPANLVGKLSPTQVKDNTRNELFIVEGDSAGGSAKQGRDRTFQAILPLRGKVLNAEKQKIEEFLNNEEILSMIHAIGGGFGNEEFNVSKSNFKKVIIMTDADDDGAHIQILLLTFFFRYMRPLIEDGRVYIALPPLYKVSNKNTIKYAWDDDELEELTNEIKNYNVQRFKGLGEMNSEQLWDTTMNPETRTLIQANIEDFGEAEDRVEVLMGDDVKKRREWIEDNVSFDFEDNYVLEEAHPDEQ